MIVLLASLAAAAEGQAISTTVVQARPDMLGDVFFPLRESLYGRYQLGGIGAEAYGDLAWSAGVDQEILPELYVLAVDGGGGTLEWTVGRARVDLPTFGRMLDGGRIAWSPSNLLRVEGWAGFARHSGLDGLGNGAPVARAAVTFSQKSIAATAGAWAEFGETSTFHADARVRWRPLKTKVHPTVSALASVAMSDAGVVFERGRFDAALRPVGGVNLRLWGEHREVAEPISALGQSILASFAPDGVNEAGAGVGWTDTRRDTLWLEGSTQSWIATADAEAQLGFTAQLSWRPTCPTSTWCVSPSWRAATGPGGLYHAFGSSLRLPLPEPVGLTLQAMVVPFQKPHEALDTAASLGAVVDFAPHHSIVRVELGGEVARTPEADFEPRGWLALRLTTPTADRAEPGSTP